MLDKMFKKVFTFIILFFVACAFSDNTQYEWTDENGCSYCLYGYIKDGKCVHPGKSQWHYGYEEGYRLFPELSFRELNNNFYLANYSYRSTFHVFCENVKDYCKTISDSMAKKLMPSLKDRKFLCNEQRKKFQNTGLLYDMPIPRADIEFLCDFANFNYKKSFLEVLDTGICPVRANDGLLGVHRTITFLYGILYVSKEKGTFKIKGKELFRQSLNHQNRKSKLFFDYKKAFFTLGECSLSNCEILNHVGDQPQDFDIKCNFIKKKDSEGNVTVLAEGVCPIEILDKDGKKQVYRVRSVKDGDSYKLIMTNKQK